MTELSKVQDFYLRRTLQTLRELLHEDDLVRRHQAADKALLDLLGVLDLHEIAEAYDQLAPFGYAVPSPSPRAIR